MGQPCKKRRPQRVPKPKRSCGIWPIRKARQNKKTPGTPSIFLDEATPEMMGFWKMYLWLLNMPFILNIYVENLEVLWGFVKDFLRDLVDKIHLLLKLKPDVAGEGLRQDAAFQSNDFSHIFSRNPWNVFTILANFFFRGIFRYIHQKI